MIKKRVQAHECARCMILHHHEPDGVPVFWMAAGHGFIDSLATLAPRALTDYFTQERWVLANFDPLSRADSRQRLRIITPALFVLFLFMFVVVPCLLPIALRYKVDAVVTAPFCGSTYCKRMGDEFARLSSLGKPCSFSRRKFSQASCESAIA